MTTSLARCHAGLERLELIRIGRSFNLHPVVFSQLEPGFGYPGLQSTVIGQQEQTFAVPVEPSGWVHA